jgi:hypothetical protein
VSVEGALARVPWEWGRDVALRRWRAHCHRGEAVACPLCGWRFDAWGPGEACWWCEAGPPQRAVWEALSARPELLAPGSSVLHFEPGWSLQGRVAARSGFDYVTAGPDPEVANLAIDVAGLALADASYDGVIAPHAVHRRPDRDRALAELRRVLRPGGWLLLTAQAADDPTGRLRAASFAPERIGETAWLALSAG